MNIIKKLFKPSEKQLRNRIKKKYSPDALEYKEQMLNLDKQYNKISDEAYDYALLSIQYHPDSINYKLYKLDLDKKYKKIDEYNYETAKLKLTSNTETNEYKIKQVELDCKFNKISEIEKEKQIATIKNEPWFKFIKTKLENDSFSFEWDCNKPFLEAIARLGYNQPDEESNVLEWLKDGFIETFDEDIDAIRKDIEDFEKSKAIKTQDDQNPNIKIYQ